MLTIVVFVSSLLLIQSIQAMEPAPIVIVSEESSGESSEKRSARNIFSLSNRSRISLSASPIRSTEETKSNSPRKDTSPRKVVQKKLLRTSSRARLPKILPIAMDYDHILKAIRDKNIDTVKNFISDSNNNLNQQISNRRTTLLHHTVLAFDEQIAMLFLCEPKVKSTIKSADNVTPFQLIVGSDIVKHHNLYNALKLREQLDRIVDAMIIIDEQLRNKECSDAIITQKIKSLCERISEKTIPSYADVPFIFAMIRSRIADDLPMIQILCEHYAKNPNYQDIEWGLTILHHAAYLQDPAIIKQLVKNPQIISLKKNSAHLYPQALLPSDDQTIEIRRILFARDSLDRWIDQQIPSLLLINPIVSQYTLKIDDEWFQEIIADIRITSKKIENAQETNNNDDRKLPEQVGFPEYADDQFLLKAFQTHMQEQKQNEQQFHFKEVEEKKDISLDTRISIAKLLEVETEINKDFIVLKKS